MSARKIAYEPRCQRYECHKQAVYEVFNGFSKSEGIYCEDHAIKLVEGLNRIQELMDKGFGNVN
jgi:hypothetical protein